jgi:hypothetical protein
MSLRRGLSANCFVPAFFAIAACASFSQTPELHPDNQAAVPQSMRYSGAAQNRAGDTVEAVFRIYASQEGGEPLWSETQRVTVGRDGGYTVLLGAGTGGGLPQSVFADGQARWLAVSMERGPDEPRVLLASVPYAMKAGDAETLAGVAAAEFVTQAQLQKNLADAAGQQGGVRGGAASGLAAKPHPTASPTGSGTAGAIPLWTGASTLGNSMLAQSAGQVSSTGSFSAKSSTVVAAIAGTNSATTKGGAGVSGTATAKSGVVYGVTGATASTTNTSAGVNGIASAATGKVYGVLGTSASSTGTGVFGQATAATGNTTGVFGFTASSGGNGVYGQAYSSTGNGTGVFGQSNSPAGVGVFGLEDATTGTAIGVYGTSSSPAGTGIFGDAIAKSGEATGVTGETSSADGYGVNAFNNATTGGFGLHGYTSATSGVGAGVIGATPATTTGENYGVLGTSGDVGAGGLGAKVGTLGVNGTCPTDICTLSKGTAGQLATATGGILLQGLAGKAGTALTPTFPALTQVFAIDAAGNASFAGNLKVGGKITKGSGSFMIDHPLDPEHKYLSHSFVESPDMMNVYNGNITTDRHGVATVVLPDYFEALNRDFRYQLTVIGQFAQAIVGTKISGNRFTIRTSRPKVEVSWQVTGIRQDAYANANRIPVEEDKPASEQGYYLHPEAFGQPASKSIAAAGDLRRAPNAGEPGSR